MEASDLKSELAKIRPHTTSKQAHQRKPALLLVALESTLSENAQSSASAQASSTAYFAVLITTLEGCISRQEITLEEGDTLPAILYLLALVLPFVPHPVLRSHMSRLFQLLPPLLPIARPSHAPPLRSLITAFGFTLMAMDQSQIQSTILQPLSSSSSSNSATSTATRQAFSTLLELTLDPRPKVRKRAAEVIRDVLQAPPSPLMVHPWSSLVAEWSCGVIAQSAESGLIGGHSSGSKRGEGVERLIHLLAFLRMIPFVFFAPSITAAEGLKRGGSDTTNLETMTKYLLTMPKLSNPYLTQASYQLLTTLLSSSNEEEEVDEISLEYSKRRREQDLSVLNTLLSIQPTKTEHQLAPYWLAVVARATVSCYSKPIPGSDEADVLAIWKVLWSFLDSTCTSETHKAAAEGLSLLIEEGCIPVNKLRGFSGKDKGELINTIVESTLKALSSLAFADSTREIVSVLTTIAKFSSPIYSPLDDAGDQANFHKKVSASHPLISLLVPLVNLRNKQDFEYKEEVNQFFGAMMQAVGVDGVLKYLPLGLLPKERYLNVQFVLWIIN
jgi:ribosomal RNA-processing protein 12